MTNETKSSMNIISFLYPNLSHPSQSRFTNMFEDKENPAIPLNKFINQRKQHNKSPQIKIENIESRRDYRTTIMLKNWSRMLSKERIKEIIASFCNINYVYVPLKGNKKIKNLGFAFVNVDTPEDVGKLLLMLKNNENQSFIKGVKFVEICYSKIQGIEELKKVFGTENIFVKEEIR